MAETKTYYKICNSNSVVLFYHDLTNDRLDGIIEEGKTDNKLVLQKHLSNTCYNNVADNALAKAMINKAKQISEKEYKIAYDVIESMVNSTEWLLADNDLLQIGTKEIVTETVYV